MSDEVKKPERVRLVVALDKSTVQSMDLLREAVGVPRCEVIRRACRAYLGQWDQVAEEQKESKTA